MKKWAVFLALSALIIIAYAIYLGQESSTKKATETSTTIASPAPPQPVNVNAQYITLQTHLYCTRRPRETTNEFIDRTMARAESLMGTFEKVSVEYYINETGEEQAIIIAEKKIRRG